MKSFLQYTLILVTLVLFIYIVYAATKSTGIQELADGAVNASDWAASSTVFIVRDKKSDRCDRLITISPFGWNLWCKDDSLFVLLPETSSVDYCSPNSTPAVRVFGDRFVETCLSSPVENILAAYSDTVMENRTTTYRVNYNINRDTRVFTIFTAINILKNSGLIDYDPRYDSTIGKRAKHAEKIVLPHIDDGDDARARKKRSVESLMREFYENSTNDTARFEKGGDVPLSGRERRHAHAQISRFVRS
ncbi:hypothetical protein QAD02_001438 [Eretmocerus hayati]|uniref:Uncharacterized protein n=1 Tax=Eretmocerus hayati TaxID=131215 RepID=A0ACC2NG09_9HYME|nr:hypothetical protein QAD02_001438 [Eretmocerus hayati]